MSKGKKNRDPLAPKRPLNAFMEFARNERPFILDEHGHLPLREMNKELTSRWKNLDEESIRNYEEIVFENRKMYSKELEEYRKKKELGINISNTLPTPSITEVVLETNLDNEVETASDIVTLPQTDTQNEKDTASDVASSSDNCSMVKLEDLGFAKQKQFPWHPAMKTGETAGGTRVMVTFLGTGQTGVVNKSSWRQYSEQVEDRIKSSSRMKNVSFKTGIIQLKALRSKLLKSDCSSIQAPSIDYSARSGGRQFMRLDKDRLQKEDDENSRLLAKKMVQSADLTWTCVACDWTSIFTHKAKDHARKCGQRKKVNKKRQSDKPLECSRNGCSFTSSSRSNLQDHYR